MSEPAVKLTRKDFVSGQDVRWCPGCGDYAILSQVQRLMPELGIARENIVFISGIGCSSRFPYYLNTYGMHTIHGRAPTIATGLKVTNPELDVWVITGDGDALSIGGNHFMHVLRRNVGVRILLFNNQIYGLTKGQYSPTSEIGKVTKSTPSGSIDAPIQPVALALGANASFVARTIDVENKHMPEILLRAAKHKGAAFVEIFQNCNIFNDGAFEYAIDKNEKADRQLILQHGAPMIFGKNRDKGLKLSSQCNLEVVTLGKEFTEKDILVHDESNPMIAAMLSRLTTPEFPVPLGVIYAVERPKYEDGVRSQLGAVSDMMDMQDLINAGQSWTVK